VRELWFARGRGNLVVVCLCGVLCSRGVCGGVVGGAGRSLCCTSVSDACLYVCHVLYVYVHVLYVYVLNVLYVAVVYVYVYVYVPVSAVSAVWVVWAVWAVSVSAL
jgi:hypothetical protein